MHAAEVGAEPLRQFLGDYQQEIVRTRAFVAAPLLEDGRLVGLFAVHSRTPRVWTPAEIELVERTAALTRGLPRHDTRRRHPSMALRVTGQP